MNNDSLLEQKAARMAAFYQKYPNRIPFVKKKVKSKKRRWFQSLYAYLPIESDP